MNGAVLLWSVPAWLGTTLLFGRLRCFSRPALAERLRPYAAAPEARRATRVLSVESFRDVIGPLAHAVGSGLARAVGVSEELAVRLERVHSPLDAAGFRLRQLGWGGVGLVAGATLAAAFRESPAIALFLFLAAPLLGLLMAEQRLSSASDRWRRRVFLELPVIAEQLATLLAAGYSLGSALNRLAQRSKGSCGADLTRVCRRIRQGLNEADALQEWASVARVDALDRLVPILSLGSDATDLGRLVSDEARNIRRDVHRELLGTLERRDQQVWIPVTVAALLPGAIFIGIPFVHALEVFSA